MKISFCKCMVLLLLCVEQQVAAETKSEAIERGKPITVSYPTVPSDPVYMERSEYFGELLDLILSRAGHPYKLVSVPVPPVPSSRTVMMMREGRYDVSWVHTNPDRERIMRAVRIPMYRGLGGWRLLFIRPEDASRFAAIKDLKGLQDLVAGQGHDWPDIDIMRHNDLVVRSGISRDSVFQLLKHSRVDYFPRGINEVWDEVSLSVAKGLVVEQHLVLRYPTAFYLFVNKEENVLAELMEKGYEVAIADGSFRRLFLAHTRATIERANLKGRTVIEMDNPLLTKKAPLDRKELWFHVGELN